MMFCVYVFAILPLALISAVPAQDAQSAASGNNGASAVTYETARDLAGKGRLDAAMAQLDQLAKETPEA